MYELEIILLPICGRETNQSAVELRTRARWTRPQSLLLPTMVGHNLPEISVSRSESFALTVELAQNSILIRLLRHGRTKICFQPI
jgi:hypothetical protein